PVDPHANNFVVKVYERGTANIVYQQTVSGSGEAILFSTVGEYDVTVTAVGTEPFTNSEESDIYEWTVLPALATPTITNIDDNGVVLFSVVENAASYLVFLYQNNGTTLINTYPFTASGGNIPVPMGGGNFKVAVQAIGDEFDYANSAVSDFYSWSVVSDLGYSSWCQRYVNSGFEEDDKEAALFTIETGLNGELIVAIDGVNGHNLNFYTDGMDVDKFSIGTQKSQNGAAYFTKDVVNSNADKQIFTLIDGQSINAGTEIWYDGVIKVKSSLPSSISSLAAVTDIFTGNTNAYTNARYRFDSYIYGTTCNSAPVIFVDNQALVFYENMPDGTNVINVTGYNLTGTVNVVVPPGYVAEPNILTPANGEVNQQVAVYWDGGFYHYRNTNYKGVGIITFDGGGVSSLNNAPRIRVLGYQMNCTEYKSYFLGDGANSWNKPVYINISLNSDSTKLLMNILPYEPTGTAVWDVAQTMIGTGATAQTTTYVKLNGNNTAVERAVTNENKTIELTFASKLQNGDVVNFRDCTPNQNIRWTISGYPLDYDNTVGSDAYKTNPYGAGSAGTNNWNNLGTFTAFTVGQLCENNAAPVIRNADAATSEIPPADITEKTETSVKVYLDILRGTNHVASVTFTDETENTEFSPLTVPFQADEKYQITGIELNKNYNFCVKITDVKGNNYGCGGDTGFQEILALISFSINEHDIVTGTSKAEQNKILIYPNPAISELKITNYKDGGIMRIFDVTGKIINIVELSNNLINVSNLNVGIYFLQIDNQVVKFVKSR
ncbi:MAG: T9SS type A sorting domain-containing protein, partial [Prevotellaceae bacterium]|nr:T9SS type A sorting domain-containing protein [Prevotellaceae bacterium]